MANRKIRRTRTGLTRQDYLQVQNDYNLYTSALYKADPISLTAIIRYTTGLLNGTYTDHAIARFRDFWEKSHFIDQLINKVECYWYRRAYPNE